MDEKDPEQTVEETTDLVDTGAETIEPADTLSDDQKEQALADAKQPARKDPTEGMSDGQKVDYYRKQVDHWQADYRKEKDKRQKYEQQYGGLGGHQRQTMTPVPDVFGRTGAPRSLDDVQDLGSYTKYILNEAKKQFSEEVTENQLNHKVERTEAEARLKYDGSNGLPAYDDLIDEYVVPMIQ